MAHKVSLGLAEEPIQRELLALGKWAFVRGILGLFPEFVPGFLYEAWVFHKIEPAQGHGLSSYQHSLVAYGAA